VCVLDKTALHELLTGRVGLCENKCSLNPPTPVTQDIYMFGHKTFIQCLGSWCCQLLQQVSEWLATFIHMYLNYSALRNSVLIYLYSITNCELCWAKQLHKRGYCTWNETRFVRKVCYHMTHIMYVFHCLIFMESNTMFWNLPLLPSVKSMKRILLAPLNRIISIQQNQQNRFYTFTWRQKQCT
jgi:hypothetical protein